MALKSWHYGKLIILWVWGIVLCTLLVYFVNSLAPDGNDVFLPVLGTAAIGGIVVIAAVLSAITWRWLGGKEEPEP